MSSKVLNQLLYCVPKLQFRPCSGKDPRITSIDKLLQLLGLLNEPREFELFVETGVDFERICEVLAAHLPANPARMDDSLSETKQF